MTKNFKRNKKIYGSALPCWCRITRVWWRRITKVMAPYHQSDGAASPEWWRRITRMVASASSPGCCKIRRSCQNSCSSWNDFIMRKLIFSTSDTEWHLLAGAHRIRLRILVTFFCQKKTSLCPSDCLFVCPPHFSKNVDGDFSGCRKKFLTKISQTFPPLYIYIQNLVYILLLFGPPPANNRRDPSKFKVQSILFFSLILTIIVFHGLLV